jgi:hypothetical protein
MSSRDESPTFGEMFEEILDLVAGLNILLLPMMILAVPGLILLLPLVLPVIPLALLAVPFLLIRAVTRRRARAVDAA